MVALPISGAYIAVPHEESQKERIAKTGKIVLGIHIVGENPVIETYVRSKRMYGKRIGATVVEYRHAPEKTTEEVLQSIVDSVSYCDGVILQLPIADHMDKQTLLNAIPPTHDVDMLNDASWELYEQGMTPLIPPVARAVKIALDSLGISFEHKKAVVVGNGRLVGKPVSVELQRMGCTVIVIDRSTKEDDARNTMQQAEILVSGVGKPHLITPEKISQGVILLDGGTSEGDGTSVGDIDYACEQKASFFARVPGGLGRLTVVSLFENLILLKESRG